MALDSNAKPAQYVILGAGGHAREVFDVLTAAQEAGEPLEVMGFLDDDPKKWRQVLNGVPILEGLTWMSQREPGAQIGICGIGKPLARMQAVARYTKAGLPFGLAVHPRATVTKFVDIGEGAVLTAGCVLTNRINLGRHVHVNLNATIGHDCSIGDYCTIAPGANISGNVRLGMGVDVGTGAAILQGLSIGDWAIIGAGAVVISDIPAGATAVGVPARVIKVSELPDIQGECSK